MRPLDVADFPSAARLLHEGFPHCPVAFWAGALQRLQHYAGNAEADIPLGWFMMAGDEPVGVVLTPASLRLRTPAQGPQQVQRIVNLSSWYVRPEYRWRAGLMLRAVLNDAATIYTDLTPTPEVQRILHTLGFAQINAGVALHFLPGTALLPARGARVRLLSDEQSSALSGPPSAMLKAHRELGCWPLLLETANGRQLLVCKQIRVRGVRAAQLIYAERRSELLHHRAALARFFLRHGVWLFAHETPQVKAPALAWFRPRDLWFARGGDFADCTDAFASELCIVHAGVLPPPEPASPAARTVAP